MRDYTGQRRGRLVFLSRDHIDESNNQYWRMKCDCGTEFVTAANNVIAGRTRSCGCLLKEKMRGNRRAVKRKRKRKKGRKTAALLQINTDRLSHGAERMNVSELLCRIYDMGYSREGMVYCTIMDYIGLPFTRRRSLYSHKKGIVRTVRYRRKTHGYKDHHTYMLDAMINLGIKGECLAIKETVKYPRASKGIVIQTIFCVDVPLKMFNRRNDYHDGLMKLMGIKKVRRQRIAPPLIADNGTLDAFIGI